MCIIILDANCIGQFKDKRNEDMKPVWNWLKRKNGQIAYSSTEKFKREWKAGGGYNLEIELRRKNNLKSVPKEDVLKKQNELKDKIKSNDPHIIALALVADVKVLVSQDKGLHEDFKNRDLVGGKVYQTKEHEHLLDKDTCNTKK